MKCKVRKVRYGWALDMYFAVETITIYFHCRKNAESVMKIIEADKKEET